MEREDITRLDSLGSKSWGEIEKEMNQSKGDCEKDQLEKRNPVK